MLESKISITNPLTSKTPNFETLKFKIPKNKFHGIRKFSKFAESIQGCKEIDAFNTEVGWEKVGAMSLW